MKQMTVKDLKKKLESWSDDCEVWICDSDMKPIECTMAVDMNSWKGGGTEEDARKVVLVGRSAQSNWDRAKAHLATAETLMMKDDPEVVAAVRSAIPF